MIIKANTDFRDHIKVDDVEKAKQSINCNGSYKITNSEIKHACYNGSIKCLRWLIEDLKIEPHPLSISCALMYGRYEIILYLIEKYGIKTLVNKECIQIMFQDYNEGHKIISPSLDQLEKFKIYGIVIDNNTNLSVYIKFCVAIAESCNIDIEDKDILCILGFLWRSWIWDDYDQTIKDVNFLLTQKHIDISSKQNLYHVNWIILTGLSDKLFIENLSFDPKITDVILSACFGFLEYRDDLCPRKVDMIINNINRWKDLYGMTLNEYNSYFACETGTKFLLDNINQLSINFLLSWLARTLQFDDPSAKNIIDYLSDKFDQVSNVKKSEFIEYAIVNNSIYLPNLIIATSWKTQFRIADIVKKYGKYDSELVTQTNFADLKTIDGYPLVDFSDPNKEDYEIKWKWYGIGKPNEGTYISQPYIKHPINPLFRNITDLTLIKENILILNELIRSPTACYFDIYKNIFYRDQQDCIIWALDEKGRVYIHNDDQPYTIIYVADSLPEFLSHIYDDCNSWYEFNRHIFF